LLLNSICFLDFNPVNDLQNVSSYFNFDVKLFQDESHLLESLCLFD
jgi:hypothetical protein